jgi:hypothetical protein
MEGQELSHAPRCGELGPTGAAADAAAHCRRRRLECLEEDREVNPPPARAMLALCVRLHLA